MENKLNSIFSGVQPTGNLHLGNYLGAIKNFVKLQDSNQAKKYYYCVVDLHAITVYQEPEKLRKDILETAATFIAAGINPQKSIIFNQSKVSCHAELAWILNCICRIGWLNRMTQFKEKAGKNRENVSVGLFAYPVLMTADILAYKSNLVPVGDDQKQHLELARDIAQKFNHDFKVNFFPDIKPLILDKASRVMSLRNGNIKMSKSDMSDYSRINLLDTEDIIVNKIRKAKTDSDLIMGKEALGCNGYFDLEIVKKRPEAINLIEIFSALTNNKIEKVLEEFSGKSFSLLKEKLTQEIICTILPIGNEVKKMLQDQSYIINVLEEGALKAREEAEKNLKELKNIVGLL